MSNLYTEEELNQSNFNFVSLVSVSRFTNFYNANIDAGSNIRIDDFCILKGKINMVIGGKHTYYRRKIIIGCGRRITQSLGLDLFSYNFTMD